ncbi:CU044_5270 family protein [Actinomadura nitritigenes]|uniref:CU044_5270 family protein n=1 Tax=Actinomadura nitritigenes TaxID=134602 RepID=UPI003D8F61CA
MGELKQMFDEVQPPSAAVLAAGRARLLDRARDGGRRPLRPRPSRGLLAVSLAGAAAVTAGAVVVATHGTGGDGPGRMRTVSAHDVLTRAAAVARLEPELRPRADQYLYVRTVVAWGPGKVAPEKRPGQETRERWLSVDGSKPGLQRVPCRRRPAKPCTSPIPIADKSQPVPRTDSYMWMVKHLPGLLDYWRPQLRHPLPPEKTDRPYGSWSWYGIGDIVGGYLPPRLRAQVFEFLSDVPGVRVDEHATDALGRPGIGLSKDSEGARLELVFDRSTYRFLGDHYLDLTPHPEGGDPTDEPDSGAGEERTTVLKVGVVDRPPARG